jgi:hypothetical protein
MTDPSVGDQRALGAQAESHGWGTGPRPTHTSAAAYPMTSGDAQSG